MSSAACTRGIRGKPIQGSEQCTTPQFCHRNKLHQLAAHLLVFENGVRFYSKERFILKEEAEPYHL